MNVGTPEAGEWLGKQPQLTSLLRCGCFEWLSKENLKAL
jgi:predicted DNA-binding ribbon-helix-helix protein